MSPRSRASQYVAAGLVTAGGLFWATRDAWPWRRPLTAQPIVITDAYVEFTETLGGRGTRSDVLACARITGRDYLAFLAAAQHLPLRRRRPGRSFPSLRRRCCCVAGRVSLL